MFTNDNRTENFLTSMGVEFRYTNDVTYQNLVKDWDKTNLARPVPLREDAILEYAALIEGGSPAPAPILLITGAGFAPLDGLQRLAAGQLCGMTKFSAYIVTCDSKDVQAAIRVLANARLQGRGEPPEWTRRRAVEILVVERGLTPQEVARMGGWKVTEVKRLALVIDWGSKITGAGGPQLPDNMIETLSQHITQDELADAPEQVAGFLNAVKTAKFSHADAEPFFQTFFAPITKVSRRRKIYGDRLERFKEEPEVQVRIHGRRGTGTTRDVTLMRLLKAAGTVLDEVIAEGDEVPYIDEFFRLVKSVDTKLRSLAKNNPIAVTADTPADMFQR